MRTFPRLLPASAVSLGLLVEGTFCSWVTVIWLLLCMAVCVLALAVVDAQHAMKWHIHLLALASKHWLGPCSLMMFKVVLICAFHQLSDIK